MFIFASIKYDSLYFLRKLTVETDRTEFTRPIYRLVETFSNLRKLEHGLHEIIMLMSDSKSFRGRFACFI